MWKLVFELAITSFLWLIRHCSVNTEIEPNLSIPNFLCTKFFLRTDRYHFLKNRNCRNTELPNAQAELWLIPGESAAAGRGPRGKSQACLHDAPTGQKILCGGAAQRCSRDTAQDCAAWPLVGLVIKLPRELRRFGFGAAAEPGLKSWAAAEKRSRCCATEPF